MQFHENRSNRDCPSTRRPRDGWKYRLMRFILPIAGLASLVWFLIRVIPKPSRALYPCQRVAFPLASGFVAWLLGLTASAAAFKKARLNLSRRRYALAMVCIALSVGAVWVAISATSEKPAMAQPQAANSPMGVGKGIHPGRVVWVHDPEATNWQGPGNGHPWQDEQTNPAVCRRMMSSAIRSLTGESTDAKAWDALFRHQNKARGSGLCPFRP